MTNTPKHIIVVAHDSMKPRLVEFLREKEAWLWGRQLIGTDQTAEFIESDGFTVPVDHVAKGREGGYRQLTNRLNKGEIQNPMFMIQSRNSSHKTPENKNQKLLHLYLQGSLQLKILSMIV